MKHVIFGGNGIVGRELASTLITADHEVTSVGRTPSRIPRVASVIADVGDAASVHRAMKGADVAYLAVGLPYKIRVWQREWPKVMGNTIDAALAHGPHLVFVDNVYAYGRVNGPMTETTPIAPVSRKGRVRAQLLDMIDAASHNGLVCTIARSADFYGPGASTGAFNSMAIDRLVEGKEPIWLLDATLPHSMTYTPDIGRALAVLGTDARGFGRTWHLPTAPALTGQEYLAMATGGAMPHRTMSLATMRAGAVFSSIARESLEMSYQNREPYVFDSSLFESTFGMSPTPYADGIARSVEYARTGDAAVGAR